MTTKVVIQDEALLEALAEVVHDIWSGWARWMLDKYHDTHQTGTETYQARWLRQIHTPYGALSDSEKETDRFEARKVLSVLAAFLDSEQRMPLMRRAAPSICNDVLRDAPVQLLTSAR